LEIVKSISLLIAMLFSDGLVINMLKTQELAYFLFKTMPLYLNSHSMSPFPIILPRCPLYAACLFYFGFLSPPSCNLCLPLGNHTFIKKNLWCIYFQMNIWLTYSQNVDLLLRKYVCTTSKLKTIHLTWWWTGGFFFCQHC